MFLIDSQDFSIPMALIDLIPVILFFISGVILLNDLYNKLVKGNYAMLATGVCMIFLAGVLKGAQNEDKKITLRTSRSIFYIRFNFQFNIKQK